MNKTLLKRTITGLIFVAVLGSGILYDSYSFLLITSIIAAAGVWEFYSLIEKAGRANISKATHAFGGFLLVVTFFLHACGRFGMEIFLVLIVYFLYTIISELYLKKADPLQNWAYIMLGQIYVALPLAVLCYLPFFPAEGNYNKVLPFAFFVIIWISDSGAYIAGSTFGRHPLFKRISPKKSWEGSLGGTCMSVVTALIFAHYFPHTLSTAAWIGMALITTVFGTLGDLSESLLKRTIGIKDSGKILPGHGGILDRFDSVLLAAPACVLYLAAVNAMLPK
ncbi:MAG: phosphatidate cytidylyltransferase [Bacteroidales bacterium]|nr:phosphatidate cytidylyltransferase [Bacteroidales bacterium]